MPYVDLILFCAVALVMVASAAAIFFKRNMMHSVLYLTLVFAGSAVVFILLGQTLIAMLQLFIFVGGFSSYLMVTVAMEKRGSAEFNPKLFFPIATIISIGLIFLAGNTGGTLAGTQMNAYLGSAMRYYPMIYMVVILLFGALIGSIVVLKKFVKLVF